MLMGHSTTPLLWAARVATKRIWTKLLLVSDTIP